MTAVARFTGEKETRRVSPVFPPPGLLVLEKFLLFQAPLVVSALPAAAGRQAMRAVCVIAQ
jgi:hypothetical protein